MPRKRTTRVQQVVKPQPSSMSVADADSKERKEQLDFFLKDFDSRVKNVMKGIEKKKRTLLTFIQTRYENHLSDLPKNIKDMTLEEFAMRGGTIEAIVQASKPVEDPKKKQLADIMSLKWTGQPLEDITEEGSDAPVAAFVKPTSARPKKRQGKTAFHTARSENKFLMKTPIGTSIQPFWGQTPLFTPKFDPNLPVTPENIRDVKPGERVLISLAGSPVQAHRPETVSSSVIKEEIAQEWSDIAGIQLTPNRVEQMLKIVSNTVTQK